MFLKKFPSRRLSAHCDGPSLLVGLAVGLGKLDPHQRRDQAHILGEVHVAQAEQFLFVVGKIVMRIGGRSWVLR